MPPFKTYIFENATGVLSITIRATSDSSAFQILSNYVKEPKLFKLISQNYTNGANDAING